MNKTVLTAILIFFISVAFAGEIKKIELENLHGSWEGVGEFIVPATSIAVEITGKAEFEYDRESKKLRTSLFGEKFMFTYSDSGYLWINPATDTISWEIWDNRDRHVVYHGHVEGNTVTGSRLRGEDIHDIFIRQVTPDSIDFKLTVTEPDGTSFDKATFHLWRKKK